MIYFKNTIKKNYYLTGAGTREQFARFYKAIYQYPEFDIRFKLKDLANYLKIPDILMVKMIQIFEELNFVTIDNGMMSVNKAAEKRDNHPPGKNETLLFFRRKIHRRPDRRGTSNEHRFERNQRLDEW